MLMQEVLSRHASHAGLTGSPATAVQDAVRRNWRVPQRSIALRHDAVGVAIYLPPPIAPQSDQKFARGRHDLWFVTTASVVGMGSNPLRQGIVLLRHEWCQMALCSAQRVEWGSSGGFWPA